MNSSIRLWWELQELNGPTRVPYLLEPPPPWDPTVALSYGDPRGVGVSYQRSTPVKELRPGPDALELQSRESKLF